MLHGTDGRRDLEGLFRRMPHHEGAVDLRDRVAAPGLRDPRQGLAVTSEEDEARGAPAQAVEGRGVGVTAAHQMQQRVVEESAAGERG